MYELLAVAVSDSAVWGTVGAAIAAIGGAIKIVWMYWTKREAERTKRYTQVLNDKDTLFKVTVDAKDDLIAEKDEEIKELGKELSRKSDAHSEKVEQLMNLTLTKVEELGEKQLGWGEKAITALTGFEATVKRLNLEGRP